MASILSGAAIVLFLVAAVSDAARRTIPNLVVVALAIVGLARIGIGLATGEGFGPASLDVVAAAGVFGMGALAFAARIVGGGDAKLLAAGALWVGAAGLGGYLLATVLAGGGLAVVYLVWRFLGPRAPSDGLPYALAIAAGGIFTTAAPLLA
jgi:prepilin peptidase CpaA